MKTPQSGPDVKPILKVLSETPKSPLISHQSIQDTAQSRNNRLHNQPQAGHGKTRRNGPLGGLRCSHAQRANL